MKNVIKRMVSVFVAITMLLLSSATHTFAGSATGDCYSDISIYNPSEAVVKPTVFLSQLQVSLDEIENTVTMYLGIKDAEGYYSKTNFHVDFDSRLSLVDKDGDYAQLGAAGKRLIPNVKLYGEHGIELNTDTDDAKNYGRDGALWEIFFTLPDNAKVGDKYNVNIMYKEGDYFLGTVQDIDEKRMQAWVFTEGIEQGCIEITAPKNPPTTTSTVKTTTTKRTMNTTTTTKVIPIDTVTTTTIEPPSDNYNLGDINSDGYIDAVDASTVLSDYALISSNKESIFNEVQKKAADVNNDGFIDAVDASLMLSYYAYMSVSINYINIETYISDLKSKQQVTKTTTTTTTTSTTTTTTTATTTTTTTLTPIGGVIYNQNGVVIKYKGITFIEKTSAQFDEIYVNFYIENNNNRDICVQLDDFSINEFMLDPTFSSNIAAGKKINSHASLYVSELKENSITDITEIETKFNIFDWSDRKYYITTKPVRIKTQYHVNIRS